MTTYKFSLSKINANPTKVVDIIKRWGICVIPSYLEGQDLAGFQQEVFQVFQYEKVSDAYGPGGACRLKNTPELSLKYPTMHKIFNDDFMLKVTKLYMGRSNFKLNHDIFLTEETNIIDNVDDWTPNMFLHTDKGWRFKFFIYVNDVYEYNGAFRCCPGKQNIGRKVRLEAWQKTSDYSKLENKLDKDRPEFGLNNETAIPIEGKAGCLMIFDTDLPHSGARILKEGAKRVICRGHSY